MSDGVKNNETGEEQTVTQAGEDLTRRVTELVGAVFGVGAAMAKSVAQATSGGQPLPEPKPPQGPLNLMIHYGLTAATNIVRTVVTSAPLKPGGSKNQAASGTSGTPVRPSVTAGSTLRVPLSIENSGAEPMTSLEFRCLRVEALQVRQGQRLGVSNVRLAPPVLSVPPRDFEKLTVFVDTTPTTAPGSYRVVIGEATGMSETAVQFDVLVPAQESVA